MTGLSIQPLASSKSTPTLFDTDIEKNNAFGGCYSSQDNRSESASPSSTFESFDLRGPSSREIKLGGVEEQKNIIKTSQPRVIQLDDAFIGLWSDSLLDPISVDWPTLIICKFKSSLVAEHIQVNKPWRATVGRLGEPRGCITTKMLMNINDKRSKNKVQVVQLISIIPSKI